MSTPLDQRLARFAKDPDDRGAFEYLEEHLFMEADWPGLADLYRRRQAAPSLAHRAQARAQLALRLGQVCEERLADGDAAIRAYTEAIRLDPSLRRALHHLRCIYAARHSWEAVLQIGEQEVALAESGEERARVFAEMGDIWLRELGDAAQAEELYERARAESRGNQTSKGAEPEASLVQSAWLAAARGDSDAALASLERALEGNPADVEALDMMLSVLEGAERYTDMSRLLERRASLAVDPDTRGAVLMRLGEIREQLGNLGDAREAYERALVAHPDHPGARGALRRVYRGIDAWVPLRSLLETSIERAQGPARVDLLCELGTLLEREFDEPEAARERFEEASALAPDDPRPREALAQPEADPAVLTMPEPDAEPLGGEQRATRVVGVLERKLAVREGRGEGMGPEAVRLRLRIGELRGGALGEPAAAIEILEPLTGCDDTLLEAAPSLAGLYDQLGRLEPLIALAERAAALSRPALQRIYWYRRAAEAARAVGEPSRAIDCYQRLLAESPRDAGARSALCDLYRSRGDLVPLTELLRAELPRSEEGRELELQLELASLIGEALGDPGGAIAHLRRCVELEPQREDLLEWALSACALRGGALAQLDFVEHAIERAELARVRAALLARRGALLSDTLQWQEEATESWRAALALDPEQPLARERLQAVCSAEDHAPAAAAEPI